jgi:hypothetical protein
VTINREDLPDEKVCCRNVTLPKKTQESGPVLQSPHIVLLFEVAGHGCLSVVFVMFHNHNFMSFRPATCSVILFSGSENSCRTSILRY